MCSGASEPGELSLKCILLLMIKIVHTVSPGSPFSPALPWNWTEILLNISNPPQALLKTENWKPNPIPRVRLSPSLQTPLSRPSCLFHLEALDPPDKHRDICLVVSHLYTITCHFMCLHFTLSPCRPCPGRPLGPEIPWKPGSPWKYRLC